MFVSLIYFFIATIFILIKSFLFLHFTIYHFYEYFLKLNMQLKFIYFVNPYPDKNCPENVVYMLCLLHHIQMHYAQIQMGEGDRGSGLP